jgi:heptosyltransferase II
MNSLVIAPQWLGDAVMTEPLLRRLAARGEAITVAALAAIAPVYRCMPQVQRVIELPFAHGRLDWGARRQLGRQLAGQFDAAYVLPNSIKSALLPWLANIDKRVGYLGEARLGLLTHRLPNPGKGTRPAMVPFYSALSGDNDVAQDRPRMVVAKADIDHFLTTHGLSAKGYHVLAPGSEYGSAKRWPAAHYAELAKRLIERDALPVVLLGSPKEAAIGAEVAAGQPQVLDLTGKTPLVAAFAGIAASKFIASNDSGLMHVAAALGVAQVAIFGSSSPEHTPPLSDAAKVIWLKSDPNYQPALDCAPCFERECKFGHTRCLGDVLPDRVLNLFAH